MAGVADFMVAAATAAGTLMAAEAMAVADTPMAVEVIMAALRMHTAMAATVIMEIAEPMAIAHPAIPPTGGIAPAISAA